MQMLNRSKVSLRIEDIKKPLVTDFGIFERVNDGYIMASLSVRDVGTFFVTWN